MNSEDLVVGVDVGSQGTCAQAIDAAGEAVATSYVPHSLAYPQPGWAEQDPLEWLAAVARALDEVRRAVDGRPLRAISFGSQLDGLVPADKTGTAVGPAIIWMDRRATAECDRAARCDRARPATRTDRLQPRSRPRSREDRLVEGPPPRAGQGGAPAGASRVVRRVASGGRAGRRSLERLVHDAAVDIATARWCEEACAAFGVDTERLGPIRPAHDVLGPVSPWLRAAAGLDPSTLVVLGCGDEMAATLGAGVIEPGAVCDVMGTAEPVCAVVVRPRTRPRAA